MKIVLVQPQIPPNTGSIGRLCAATGMELVLIEPLGFSLDDKYLRRAGLDYWPWIDVTVTDNWRSVLDGSRVWLFSSHATTSYTSVQYQQNDCLVFGREADGLPPEVMEAYPDSHLTIPMDNTHVRSLNLAQCAAIVAYEARRQLDL